jgi:tRNA(Ile)-lysidine synthase
MHQLSSSDQTLALRGIFAIWGMRMPSEHVQRTFTRNLIEAGPDRMPTMILDKNSSLRRYREVVYRVRNLPTPIACPWSFWPLPLELPEKNGVLTLIGTQRKPIETSLASHKLVIQYRRGGEKIRIEGRQGHHALRNLFQEEGIPPWIRERLPLLYREDQLLSVGGIWMNADTQTETLELGVAAMEWSLPDGLDPGGVVTRLKNKINGGKKTNNGKR